jgi:multiple sugar transport system ATP-binding protein
MQHVQIDSISKKFGNTEVLNKINFQAEIGEFVVLVGASGCGKSTLLRLIAGLENCDSGSIYIDGKDVSSLPPAKRDIAMVFQNYALYPHLSVYDNMAFGLRQRKISELNIKSKIDSTSEILQIEHLLNRKPKALSGGQRQRVALGRAMVRDPKVFLFDEPLSNLDAQLRQEMRKEIKKLHKLLKKTMIYVTHDQTEAMTMGDRVAIMKNGVIEQIESPEQVYNKPKNQFVASFIGSPQMNFIKGFISREDNKFKFSNADMEFILNKKIKNDFLHEKEVVTLGIRPENIHNNLFTNLEDSSSIISAEVEMVENMGSFKLVHFILGGTRFSVEIRNYNKQLKKMDLVFDINKIHFFDTNSGELIN